MGQDTTLFKNLRMSGWRQFANVEIEFHPRLTIITGSNGAGKSTILNMLSGHLGASRPYLGVPQKSDGYINFVTGLFKIPRRLFEWATPKLDNDWNYFGQLEYTNGVKALLSVPKQPNLSYSPRIQDQQPVLGFHMPSHRLMPNYQAVPHIPFEGIKPSTSFQTLINETYSAYSGGHTGNTLLFQLKKILAAWAAIGEGNSIISSDIAQLNAYTGFVEILRKIIPKEIGFIDLKIQPPDVILQTRSGPFLIDAASGGLLMIIEIAALIYACSLSREIAGKPFAITFDEPENHLHPSLQRSLLPTLIEAFPSVQFIVATHSPFMVSSMKDSNVYALRYQDMHIESSEASTTFLDARKVESLRLDYVSRSGTASEILRDVLGVPTTFPEWVERDLETIVDRYAAQPVTKESMESLKKDIEAAGLEDLFAEAVARIGNPQ